MGNVEIHAAVMSIGDEGKQSYNQIGVLEGIAMFTSVLQWLWKHLKHGGNTTQLWLTDHILIWNSEG